MSQPNRELPRPGYTTGPKSAWDDREWDEQQEAGTPLDKAEEQAFPESDSSQWEKPPPEEQQADAPQGTSGSLMGYDPEILIALER